MPRVTFSDPEVAQIGLTEAEARDSHPGDIAAAAWPIDRVDRAVCDNDHVGMIKIITTRDGTILGATIIGQRAGEAIMELVLAMERKLKVSDLAGTIHPYPTFNSGIQLLATEMAVERTLDGLSGQLIRAASKWCAKGSSSASDQSAFCNSLGRVRVNRTCRASWREQANARIELFGSICALGKWT